ncbi:ribosome-associated translation inhibitor RaiA [Candidatus Gracilibacteria bacterium]|nr:ribosome-associated translation inhibitor RaiA [Candidatus Gracilibacteria bacterium]
MKIEIYRDGITLSETEESFIREKIEHLAKYADRIDDEATIVQVKVAKNKIEITMYVPHSVIRAEEGGETMDGAIKNVCEKLEKQIEKYKESEERRTTDGDFLPSSTLENVLVAQDEFGVMSNVIKRKKLKKLKPMSEEEAITQMELIGHDFFVYRNEGDGAVHVVYKRKSEDGYGTIDVDEEA